MSIADFNRDRVKVHASQLAEFGIGGAINTDFRRSRPRWFDGRFLKAEDLNREANYFLSRQADLAVATGTGVVEGLLVTADAGSAAGRNTRIRISQGHGMTFDGERVFLPNDVTIGLQDIPPLEELNVKLGLSRRPAPPDRARTGIYIVALRPLEFTANPTASYPVDVNGERTVRDGDIVEATAITLVPYAYPGAGGSEEQRRARIAHSIFAKQADYRAPSSTLPLAMLEIRRGAVLWVDNNMVRRDMGSVYSDVLGFGFAPRPLRRAHFKQYDEMIEDIVATRTRNQASLRFGAAEYFPSLPSAGRLPVQCVDLAGRTQHYFPDTMDVELSIIPEDELATLVEESLLLPPILLDQEEDVLASNSVMILIPVERHVFYGYTRELRRVPLPIRFPPRRVPSRLSPGDYLNRIRTRLPDFRPAAEPVADPLAEAPWAALLSAQQYLWYVRRRNLSYKDEVTGTAVHVLTREHEDETEMRRFQRSIGLYDEFTRLKVDGSAAADLEMVRLLTIPKFTKSEILMRAALREFKDRARRKALREQDAAAVSVRFARRTIGRGIDRIRKKILSGNADAKRQQMAKLAESLRVPELDIVADTLNDEELAPVAEELKELLKDDQVTPKAIAKFILEKKEELEQ